MRFDFVPVEELTLDLSGHEPPPEAMKLIEDVDRLIDVFDDTGRNLENRNYIPSDGRTVYSALAAVTENDLPIGRVFCELGSGFGLGVCLASQLGYEAYGVEIDKKLVNAARDLARRHRLEPELLCASYFPDGYSAYEGIAGSELLKPDGGWGESDRFHFSPRFEGMDRDTDEVDVYFAYPWPKEHELMMELFAEISGDGAIFIAYYGDGEICAYRKTMAH